jgi:VanZ family protein
VTNPIATPSQVAARHNPEGPLNESETPDAAVATIYRRRSTKSVFCWLFVSCLVLIVIASLSPGAKTAGDTFNDKVAHFLAYASAGLLAVFGFSGSLVRMRWLVYLVVLGVVLEFAQKHIPGRRCDLLDMLANVLGVFVGFIANWRVPS